MTEHADTSLSSLALFSISRAAKELKVGADRIHEMINKCEIGVVEMSNGRLKIPRAELERWVKDNLRYKQIVTPENGRKVRSMKPFNARLAMQQILLREKN